MADARIPFYIQITPVKEDFLNGAGRPASVDLPLVTLPPGTVLFRGLKIPNASKGEDIRYFYRDFLGDPESGGKVCLSPIHNVFFYPFPYIAFGASDVGKTFTMIQMVVLVNPVTIVAAISPSRFVRGMAKRYDGGAPWQRCNNFTGPDVDCHAPSEKEMEARSYDNCLNPDYQLRSGVRGWMAIANLDSLNPLKKGTNSPTNSMKEFVKRLETLLPGQGSQAVANTYTDDQGHAGFPEIALYPYKNHKGRQNIVRPCSTDMAAMRLIEQEASADNFNYLPLATFTKNGIFDMVNQDFNYQELKPTPNAFNAEGAQDVINQNVFAYMNKLQNQGIDLPFYGKSQLYFDSRTGFFVLNKVVPQTLRIPIPKAIQNSEGVAATTSYQSLLLPLNSDIANRRVNMYSLMFRSFLPENYMKKYGIDQGFGFRRSMIFNRYPILTNIFKDLGIAIPGSFKESLNRAGKLYARETGRPTPATAAPALAVKTPAAATAAAATASAVKTPAPTPAPAPVAVPKRPEDEVEGVNYYKYANVTPPSSPKTPTYSGGGSGGKKTPKRSRKATLKRQTRKQQKEPVKKFTSLFRRVWKIHGKNKA